MALSSSRLDRFARLDEPGEQRIHPLRPHRIAPQQQPVAMHDHHDHHRVGARKMLRAALRTFPHPAAALHDARRAAVGAEPVCRVPLQQRFAGRDDLAIEARQRRHQPADLGELRPRQARVHLLGLVDELPDRRGVLDRRPQRDVGSEDRPVRRQPDKDRWLATVGQRRMVEAHRMRPAIGIGQQLALPEHQRLRPRILFGRIAGAKRSRPVEFTGVKSILIVQGSTCGVCRNRFRSKPATRQDRTGLAGDSGKPCRNPLCCGNAED